MKGSEYEQFARAVLREKLKLPPEELQSTHSPGVTLPGASSLQHQIDNLAHKAMDFFRKKGW